MKSAFIKEITPYIKKECGDLTDAIVDRASCRLDDLLEQNKDESVEKKRHSKTRIYPAIATFYAIVDIIDNREKARQVIYDYYTGKSQQAATILKIALKIPKLYKKMPALFERATKKNFSRKAGFDYVFYDKGHDVLAFDMTDCPYLSLCQKYACTEIVTAFCDADDITYGNMHTKLKWGRTKTLGHGQECCDFRLNIID